MFIYKYSQLTERIPYSKIQENICVSKKLHLGQLKLLMSEILFLTKKAEKGNKVLYVGAAEGYHISKLADMFPFLQFDLWDPGRFKLEMRPNIKIYNNFFTNDDAYEYKKEENNILFISDIRNLDIAKYQTDESNTELENKIDNIIENDNNKQLKWVQIIKPKYAYLKFRLPYRPGISKYIKGTIYLQPYAPISTEVRLLTNDYNKLVDYDNVEHDERMAYFNCFIRNNTNLSRFKKIMKKYNIKNIWDNYLCFYILYLYLDKIHNIPKSKLDDETAKLFLDIINFLNKKYIDKYNILLEKNN